MIGPGICEAARRRSADFARAWRHGAANRALESAFDAVDAQDAEAVARVAARMLRGPTIADLIRPMIAALAADPWFEPPLRVSRDPLRVGAELFRHTAVTISTSVLSAATLAESPQPASVAVSGRLTIVRYVRGGGARLRLWTAEPAGPDFRRDAARPITMLGEIAVEDGMVLRLDGRVRAGLIVRADRDVVALTAAIRAGAAPFQREYALPDGRLTGIATLDEGAARTQMLLTWLRHAGRADAAPWYDAATRDGAFFLRWAAMREWLALDARAALPRLRAMADDANAEVRAAALATLPMAEAACRS